MTTTPPLAIVRTLRALARRAAHGELVASTEVIELLDSLGPSSLDSVCARVMRAIARTGDLREPMHLRRLYHAARSLADRLERETVREGRLLLSRAG